MKALETNGVSLIHSSVEKLWNNEQEFDIMHSVTTDAPLRRKPEGQ